MGITCLRKRITRRSRNLPRVTTRRLGIRTAPPPNDNLPSSLPAITALIADDASWNGIFTLSLIKGEDREFAEQCVAEHPAQTEEEIADADAALKPELAMFQTFASHQLRFMGLVQGIGTLVMFVCLPALIAAVLFRGGLVLLMAGVTFVRRDGKRASRLRVFWRALVAWSPLWLVLLGLILLIPIFPNGPPKELKDLPFWLLGGLYGGLYSGLAILSGALPKARPAGPPRRNLARAAVVKIEQQKHQPISHRRAATQHWPAM